MRSLILIALLALATPAQASCPFPIPKLPPSAFLEPLPRHIVLHFGRRYDIEAKCSDFWTWRIACSQWVPGMTEAFPAQVWIPLSGYDGIDTECQKEIFDHEIQWHVAGNHREEPPQ